MTAPGRTGGELPGPGSCVVLAATKPTTVEVEISAVPGSSNLDAKFSLDLLDAGSEVRSSDSPRMARKVPRALTAVGPTKAPPAERHDGVVCDVMAHVARRGDVPADQESWIAGPRAPSAVEGFAITCHGADVGVSAQIATARGRGIWSEWHEPGAFVGSRQQANAITGMRLRLVGADAGQYILDCKALILNAPVAERRGAEVEFSSFGTSDPIVGFSVRLVPSGRAADRAPAVAAEPRRTPSRVRVFR